jgi:pimeloyl-ACP methyl ester carboxylesterase
VATFVLIHMACAGAWAWGRVPELLRDAGHEAIAPDLDLSAGQTPQTHAAAVAALVTEADGVVLAGHSYGGMVVPPLAEMCAPRVQHLIVLDGFVPADGESVFSMRPAEIVADRRAAAAERGDGLWPPPAASRGDPEWMSRLVPMPLSAFEEPVRVSPAVASLPGTFIRCTRSDMGQQAERARRRGWRVIEVEATHFVPLTRPSACARALLEAAGQETRRGGRRR